MILCIGLIIAVYTFTRLGVDSLFWMNKLSVKSAGIISTVATGLIGLITLWMLVIAATLELKLSGF